MKKLKQIECEPSCGFMVRSHDEDEVIKMARDHVKSMHDMAISKEDAKKKIKMV